MWVEDRPEQFERLRRNLRKGCRILHYGNFPKLNSPNPSRAQKARAHSGPDGRNPWDQLEAEIRKEIGGDQSGRVQELEREKLALENKLQEALKEKAAKNGAK